MTRSKRNPKLAERYAEAYYAAMRAGTIAPVPPAGLSVAAARKIAASMRDLVRAS